MAEESNNKRKKSKVSIDKERFIHVELVSDITEQDVEELIKEIEKALEKVSGKAKIIVGLHNHTIIRSSGFRKRTAAKLKSLFEKPGFEKAVIFGGNTTMRTIASFIMAATGVKNIKIFKTKEEGLKWLKRP